MTGSGSRTAAASVARTLARRGLRISLAALLGLAGVYVLALKFTPVELRQGPAQKIFYLHVPAAWSALIAFSLVGVTSALYLWLHDPRLDRFAASSAEVGVAFSAVMLTTGPIWAKPIWGTWWTWDARLTLTLFLFFLFIGYLALRASVHDPEERARFSAVVGILGMLLVPFIHLSVYLFRTLHPQPVVLKPSAPSLPPEMLRTLLVSTAVFTLLYVGLVTLRYALALAEEARDEAAEATDAG
ncbi:MAG TPA: cytochrome c biogenesis protein CcsA [Gemmatimonadales bacterium]|jgi:heme exporter protein C|nr:cytochrome c biogenesis protein CcsA [Gemmatimonadales bacterium]